MTDRLNIIPSPKGWWRNGENCFVDCKICGDFKAAADNFCKKAAAAGYDFSAGEGGVTVKKTQSFQAESISLKYQTEKLFSALLMKKAHTTVLLLCFSFAAPMRVSCCLTA